ncbi:MAG: TlpA family protein disulfide reductase [Planctomycetes bacterium]|nr:TlpA family protein disulfide reductase [Planctomycetota bacterium]
MLGHMIRAATLSLVSLLAALPAQRTLTELQQRFVKESQALDASGGGSAGERRDALLARHTDELRAFVADVAAGDDRWNGRLMLADLLLARRNRDAAIKALHGIDSKQAPALLLATAATMAQHLGLKPLRDEWVAAARGKDAPLPDRLAMARMLMTVLQEIPAGEEIFAQALTAAGDDEQRSFVRWHQADALRDREDLPENAAFEELEKLAKDLPATYWGSVAKDRLRASHLQPGDAAIDVRGKTLAGEPLALDALKGKAVVLVFWSLGDRDLPALVAELKAVRTAHGDAVAVVAIALDRDVAATKAAIAGLGFDAAHLADGKGVQTDAALRWFVEGPTVHVVDAAGKVGALGQHAGTDDARSDLRNAIDDAVKAK